MTLDEMCHQPPTDDFILNVQMQEYLADAGRLPAFQQFVPMFQKLNINTWGDLASVDRWANSYPYRVTEQACALGDFLSLGGSCKEFAAVKLTMLRCLGFSVETMFLAALMLPDGEEHEVALIRLDGALMIMSNWQGQQEPPTMLALSQFASCEALWFCKIGVPTT